MPTIARASLCLGLLLTPLTACSLLLDPEELTQRELAEAPDLTLDADDTQVPPDTHDARDTLAPDTRPADTTPDGVVDTLPDTTPDTTPDTLADTTPPDTTPADTIPPDTTPVDTIPPDTTPADTIPPDTTPVDTSPPDTGPTRSLIVRHSGEGSCVLDYYLQPITACPKSCGWRLVVDASESEGYASFRWRFGVTGGYVVSPESAIGATVELTLGTPACALLSGANVGPATVLIEVAPDDEPFRVAATLDFAVRLVTSCGSSPNACPAP